MTAVPLNPAQRAAWATVSDVLAPDGVLDPRVCALYLGQHIQTSGSYHYIRDLDTLYAVLKQAPDLPETKELFIRMYHALRTDGNMKDLLGDIAQYRPDALANWLLSCRAGASTTLRICVLQDAKRYLPHEALKNYLSGSWEKISAKGFSKSFSPVAEEIPYLMEAALEMQTDTDPAMRTLSTLLQQGCFVATYKMAPDENTSHASYDTVRAFRLAERMQPSMSAFDLFELVGHRLKGESLTSDALDYVISKLESNEADSSLAFLVFLEVYNREVVATSGALHYKGYLRLYELTREREGWTHVHEMLEKRFLNYVAETPQTSGQPIVSTHVMWRQQVFRENAPLDLVQRMLVRAVDYTQDLRHQQLLRSYLFPFRGPDQPFTDVHYLQQHHGAMVLRMCTPGEILQSFEDEWGRGLGLVRQPTAGVASNAAQQFMRPTGVEVQLRNAMLHALDKLTELLKDESTGPSLHAALMKTTLLPRLILTYCMAGALVPDKDSSLYMLGVLPNMQFHPFPLLRAVYPEHRDVWQSSQVHMLSQSVVYMRQNMPSVMEQLFDTFAKVYVGDQLCMNHLIEMGNVLGIHPILSLESMLDKTPPTAVPDLDMAVFDFGNV